MQAFVSESADNATGTTDASFKDNAVVIVNHLIA